MYLEKGVGRMKLKFVDQPYQTDAVNAICDIFDGCEVKDSLFTIEVDNHNKLDFDTEGVDYFIGHSNKLSIDDFSLIMYKISRNVMIFKWQRIFRRETLRLKWKRVPVKRMFIRKQF